ncbi:FkbM family methyltransferase [Stieleria mannarensis]|uniref:FkbM family methyltransferase n=1 Tax=Stieleria mannarensis TaxID=2755585 RepID=UPI0016028EC5|nr:FkbM family methyltransferase [Rhodopirellula sp. JC639]
MSLNAIRPENVGQWQPTQPMMMRVAASLNRLSPRGKGAIPRTIGRRFGTHWKTTITTDSGCVLAVDPANLDLYVTIENEGAWEPWILRACAIVMRRGGVMFDVGANAGAVSNETALACPGITIKAFEPQQELAELVAVSACLNGLNNIDVFPVAVGEHDGTVELHKPAHALHASLMASDEAGESIVKVPLVALDGTIRSGQLPPPNLIKIDVEGGELGVLSGAQKTIAEHQPALLFEANESANRFGYSRDDLCSLIRQCAAYEFFVVAPGDVLAVPTGRAEEFEPDFQRLET